VVNNKQSRDALINILNRARALLALSNNDFSWSSWQDTADGLAEVDTYLSILHSGDLPSILQLQVLFAPTGPLQEVSLSSGWSSEFLALARDFDATIVNGVSPAA
jgi:hypothetical protein